MFHFRGGAFIVLIAILSLTLAACQGNLAGEPQIVSTLPPPTAAPPTAEGAAGADTGGDAASADVPQSAPNVGMGAAVFVANNCAECHAIDGSGNSESYESGQIPYPGDMTDRVAVAADTPEQWFQIITNGNLENLMPPWGGSLSTAERWAVAMYVYTLSYAPEQIEQGETVFAAHFADLDAFDFSDPAAMVSVSDQQIYDTFADSAPESVSEDDIWNAAAYARTLSLSGVDTLGADPAEMAAAGAGADTADGAGMGESAETTVESVVGNITGEIVNGTQGGTAPDEATITLYVLNQGMQGMSMIDTREIETTDGTYTFEGVDISPDYTYVTMTSYRDHQFLSEPRRGMLELTDNALELPIEVYELTEDKAVVSIERMVMQVTAVDHGLQIAQVATFTNSSDRVFTSSQALDEEGTRFGSTVMFLPPGAAVMGFGSTNPDRYVVSDEDFAVIDTIPLMPGEEHIMQVVYLLPYDAAGAIIEHPVAYDFDGSVRLLVSPESLTVDSEQLERMGEQQFGQDVFAEYGSDVALTEGGAISYELSGEAAAAPMTTAAATGGSDNTLPMILFAISGVLAVTAGGLWAYGRMNKTEPNTDKQIDELVSQIAELDRQHDAGQLNHDLWHKQRDELKAELKALMEAQSSDDEQ